ncbi:MAG: substrate-binding domain-containing protein [Thomasclavelia sp.]
MKKIIYILLISLFITGCGEKTKIKTEKSLYFVFATPLKEHEIWLKAKEGFDKACSEKKIHGDWLGPTAIDTAKMEEVIETAIAQKADAIITKG